jgi:hypothetical protein
LAAPSGSGDEDTGGIRVATKWKQLQQDLFSEVAFTVLH